MYWMIGGLIWLGCGVLGTGWFSAYLLDEYPTVPHDTCDQFWLSILSMFGGPVVLFFSVVCGHYKHGWKSNA